MPLAHLSLDDMSVVEVDTSENSILDHELSAKKKPAKKPAKKKMAGSPSLPSPLDIPDDARARARETTVRRTLAHLLKSMRREAGLSQTELADRTGMKQPAIARIESVTGPWPAQETLAAYAHACGQIAVLGFIKPETTTTPQTDQDASQAGADLDARFLFLPLGSPDDPASNALSEQTGIAVGGVYGLQSD